MSEDPEQSIDGRPPQFAQGRPLYLGTLVQFALRVVIVIFVAVTLLCVPPTRHLWTLCD